MELKEFKRMVVDTVLSNKVASIPYTKENKENIDKFLSKGYFIDHVCFGERVLLFTKKLISDIKNRRRK